MKKIHILQKHILHKQAEAHCLNAQGQMISAWCFKLQMQLYELLSPACHNLSPFTQWRPGSCEWDLCDLIWSGKIKSEPGHLATLARVYYLLIRGVAIFGLQILQTGDTSIAEFKCFLEDISWNVLGQVLGLFYFAWVGVVLGCSTWAFFYW